MPIALPRRLPIVTRGRGAVFWRVHRREHAPLWFGPSRGTPPRGRFDAPAGEFGVCYFGESTDVAVLETLVRGSRRVLDRTGLEARAVSTVAAREPMRFLQFEGAGLARLGIGAEHAHAAAYADCQQMALDLFNAHPDVDGIQYRSRWDNSLLCWAVFERALPRLYPPARAVWLGEPGVLEPTLDHYELEIV